MVLLRRFRAAEDRDAFFRYLRLKHDVFILEQGWPLSYDAATRAAEEDPFDGASHFVLATGADGATLGIVRGTFVDAGFPHCEWFEHHFREPAIPLSEVRTATVNALATAPQVRGQRLSIPGRKIPMTVGKALMCELIDWLREDGGVVALLTTARGPPAIFFEHLGFYVVDAPFCIAAVDFELLNMAMLLTDPTGFQEKASPLAETCPRRDLTVREARLKAYFEGRHREILEGATVEQYAGRDKGKRGPR